MEPAETISVQFSYKPADMEHAHRVYHSTRPMQWISAAVAICALTAGCLTFYGIGASYVWSLLDGQEYPFIGVSPLWFGILSVLLALALWFDPLGVILRHVNYRRNVRIYAAHTEMEFDEVGISVVRDASREMYEWRFFNEAIEGSREFLLVVAHSTAFLVIPKRAFLGAKQEGFRALLARKVAKLKPVRRSPPLFLP